MSTQTHTICSTHWSTYPKIHSRRGIDGVSCRLKISTPITTPIKISFHRMPTNITGLDYAQSLWRCFRCSAAISGTIIDGALIIRRSPVRRRNRAALRRLALRSDR
ncbi:hypothetical protein B296_00016896 [Ensete ventricosum]|uniref:Uncharacterized protein n=1 Tax=Ensete ventricosum TaxID=4639 RepID=A0A427AIK1_ENSVE|nr:hypothetical protein B296_00016896 [Ensete ventricosum]